MRGTGASPFDDYQLPQNSIWDFLVRVQRQKTNERDAAGLQGESRVAVTKQ